MESTSVNVRLSELLVETSTVSLLDGPPHDTRNDTRAQQPPGGSADVSDQAEPSGSADTRRGSEADGGRPHAPSRRQAAIPPKLYRIGELVEFAGVSRQTIHNYATMGLLNEAQWTKGGHRLFGPEVFERLQGIAGLKADGMSMQEIRDYYWKLDNQEPSKNT